MHFSAVPQETKTQIKNAGTILLQNKPPDPKFHQALELAERWRACHAYPLNTFQTTLRTKLRRSNYTGEPIAAQRLKRMPTIINKLKLYPAMNLTTMQDIGGVRAILGSVKEVYALVDDYRNSDRLAHDLSGVKDYIKSPRSEDGYRSVHLIYRYKNARKPDYNGLRIELQIRTRLQHIWATTVESMGTVLGQALKSRQGEQQWLDFFAITSSAIAHMEETSPIPRFSQLSLKETFQRVARAEQHLGALRIMRGLSVAVNAIPRIKPAAAWFYHLIILDSLNRTVRIQAYDRDSIKDAVADYAGFEARAAKGEKIEPVLVSAGPIKDLRLAYPNFFLDIGDFVQIVSEMIPAGKSQ